VSFNFKIEWIILLYQYVVIRSELRESIYIGYTYNMYEKSFFSLFIKIVRNTVQIYVFKFVSKT